MTYAKAMTHVAEGLNAYRDYWVVNHRYATRVRMIGKKLIAITSGRHGSVSEYAPTDKDKQADDWKVFP